MAAGHANSNPVRKCRRCQLVSRERCRSQRFKIEVLSLLDAHTHKEDCASRELPGRLVSLADRVAAVVPDAETITGECELSGLSTHRSGSHDCLVDVEIGGSERLVILTCAFPNELHAQAVLARLQLGRHEL